MVNKRLMPSTPFNPVRPPLIRSKLFVVTLGFDPISGERKADKTRRDY